MKRTILAVATLSLFALAPGVFTQVPPSGVLVGPNLTSSLRNAAAATREQATVVRITANTWARRANTVNYRVENLVTDLHSAQLQYQALRERFNWMASLALEARRPYANNTLAELDAGLNIIEELLFFLDQQIAAGSLDRATLVRTCGTLEEVMRQWEQEFRRSSARMGVG